MVLTSDQLKARKAAYNKKWRVKHHAELLEKERLWREKNVDVKRARTKAWRLKNREKLRLQSRDRYHAERDANVEKKRLYNQERRNEINAKSRVYRAANLAKVLERADKYRTANRETLREKNRLYGRTHKAECLARVVKRQAAKKRALPIWADQDAITAVYRTAALRTKETGVPHHVDHVYPLRGKTVCGLHVAANLQVILGEENLRKSNKHPERYSSP